MGRHSAPDDDEDEVVDVAERSAPSPGTESGGAADLRLLREDPSLRARCAAAVAVPFAIYTVVMIVIGKVNLYLLWVWLPTVLAGILVGMFLDRAHKSHSTRAPS
ncbi:MAG TPA: hypothetical protein VJ831_10320 [Jatrophihabitantaceae bacterium]|nr:hypothetical protein [Jatrophihabitantaceae bacterium]